MYASGMGSDLNIKFRLELTDPNDWETYLLME